MAYIAIILVRQVTHTNLKLRYRLPGMITTIPMFRKVLTVVAMILETMEATTAIAGFQVHTILLYIIPICMRSTQETIL